MEPKPVLHTIRLGPEHLNTIARIHQQAFPQTLLTALGGRAVARYYARELHRADQICLGAMLGNTLIGFCFAGLRHEAFSQFIRGNAIFLLLTIICRPWVIIQRSFFSRLRTALRLFLRPALHKPASRPATAEEPSSCGVLAIAVDPSCQRFGAGRLMLETVEIIAIGRGWERMHLMVYPSNSGAVTFYLRLGWQRIRHHGAWVGGMEKTLVERVQPAFPAAEKPIPAAATIPPRWLNRLSRG